MENYSKQKCGLSSMDLFSGKYSRNIVFFFSLQKQWTDVGLLEISWNSVDLTNLSSFAILYNESHLSNCIASCFSFQEMVGMEILYCLGK